MPCMQKNTRLKCALFVHSRRSYSDLKTSKTFRSVVIACVQAVPLHCGYSCSVTAAGGMISVNHQLKVILKLIYTLSYLLCGLL